MILSTLKFIISFGISFTILCIPINQKPLFSYAYNLAGGHAVDLYNETTSTVLKTVKSYSKKILNSAPDNIQIKNAGRMFDSGYTDEEQRLLDKILNK